jgi:hypothetical protein
VEPRGQVIAVELGPTGSYRELLLTASAADVPR